MSKDKELKSACLLQKPKVLDGYEQVYHSNVAISTIGIKGVTWKDKCSRNLNSITLKRQ